MKTLSVSLAALAVAGMTALPAHAQDTVLESDQTISAYGEADRTVAEEFVESRYYSADRETYAVFDSERAMWNIYDADDDSFVEAFAEGDYEPYEAGFTEVKFRRIDDQTAYAEPDRTVAEATLEKRYYSEDRTTYGILDPVQSVWTIYDADTDAFVRTAPQAEYEPFEDGYVEVEFRRNDNMAAYDEPDRGVYESMQGRVDASELRAGIAEERYYDADRATYGVWDPEARAWNVFDAETETLLETVPERNYVRYERGYTVVIPGGAQVGLGVTGEMDPTGESIGADTDGISDNRE